jgi:hypothetical protein
MVVETIGEAWQLGWRVTARCAHGKRDGMKSIRECICTYDLDMSTLIWTRGKNFPLDLLASRLKCPRCGSSSISLLFHTPKEPVTAIMEHHPPRNPRWLGFESRGSGDRWKATKPYHVALEDSYIRRNWDEINGLCKLNGIPFEATGERISGTSLWCVYQFAKQTDAMKFWARFEGKWLVGREFVFPQAPEDMPTMEEQERPRIMRRKPPDLRR